MRAYIYGYQEATMKNTTPAIDEETRKEGRHYAKKHNFSLNSLIRRLFKKTEEKTSQQWIKESFQPVEEAQANSRGKIWKRENLYRV